MAAVQRGHSHLNINLCAKSAENMSQYFAPDKVVKQ